jgi:hypothetical protein
MSKNMICIVFCTLLIVSSLSVVGTNNSLTEQAVASTTADSDDPRYTTVLVRIDTTQGYIVLPRGVEIVGERPGAWIDVIMPRYLLNDLTASGVDYSVLIWDVDKYDQSVKGSYHTLAQIESILANIAANYPDITSLYSIGTTYQGRDIWCLEITDNPGVDEGEPGVFYTGLHHAREWPTVEICLYIADQLTSLYGSNPDITDVVNNRRLWLVTCVNPDGYYYCYDLGNDWRKNRHWFPQFGTYGVDLNRNYDGSCNGDDEGAWGSIGEGVVSHNSDQSVYCGPSPVSELEAQAIRDLFLQNDICALISWHTHGELVLWPWGYTPGLAPDSSYMASVGTQIAQRITQQDGTGTYLPEQSCGLYPTTGDTTDWAYGYSHYVLGRPCFAYTIEACNDFHPPSGYLDQVCQENFDGALYLLQEAENIRDTVSQRVIPPVIDDLSNDSDGNYVVSWQEQNPSAAPDVFQLDELTDLSLFTDDAESGSSAWILNGFSRTTTRSHSPTYGYRSHYPGGQTSSMTTVSPIPIAEGMTLSFWCWYDIETYWDYAFVEVSRDGRCYDLLESFTGSSGWVYKSYSLDAYADESIFIRFRYTTDSYVEEEGFYVDDISPIAHFDTVTTLSNSITDHDFPITGRPNGDYYYRVRGHNTARGWGDFSTLEKITVTTGANEPPTTPITPQGPTTGKTNVSYQYNTTTTDPNGDQILYNFSWGDGTYSGWFGPYPSGQTVNATHTWPIRGDYPITVIAKDIHDEESSWSNSLSVTIYLAGDCNSDGIINVGDVVFLINYLFRGGQAPEPLEVGDTNSDGEVNLGDVVYLINYLYRGGSPP